MRRRADGDLVDLLRHRARRLPTDPRRSCRRTTRPGSTCSTSSPTLKTSLSVFTARCTVVCLDRRELRIALERDVGRLQLLLVHARGLRNLRHEHRFGGLIGAGHRRQHARALVLERDLLEVRRQRRRGERPRSGEVRRREPAARRPGSRRGRSCPCGRRRSRCCSPTAARCPGPAGSWARRSAGSAPPAVRLTKTFGTADACDRLARAGWP